MYRHCAFREPISNNMNISAAAGYQNPVDKCLVLISATSGRKHVGYGKKTWVLLRELVLVLYINFEINANIHNNMSAFKKG